MNPLLPVNPAPRLPVNPKLPVNPLPPPCPIAITTLKLNVIDSDCGIASVTVIVYTMVDGVNNIGVPEIVPVAALKLNPNGSGLTSVFNEYVYPTVGVVYPPVALTGTIESN